jgi:phosphonate transport system permease protein
MSVLPSTQDRSVGGERQVLLLSRYPTLFVPFYEKHWKALSGLALAALLFLYGVLTLGVSPSKIFFGLGELALMVMRMFPPDAQQFNTYLYAIAETLAIALLGTLSAAVVAFPLGFLAARNTTINRFVHFFARRSFDTLRGIDILIWALIWINVVGLGPFAGVLALFMSDLGIFGKLYSEAIEAADQKPVEGVLSTGGTHATSVRFGVLPQVMPILLSQVLYAFESNTRSASIIGIVGAGGVGLILSEQIRTMELQQLSCVILMILVTVALIDFFCSKIRFAIIGKQAL